MANNDFPRLCGGTFFTLLLQTIKQRSKARDRYNGGSDGLSDTEILIGLIRVAQPGYIDPAASTFSQNTSAYKACNLSNGVYLPFNDSSFIGTFDEKVKSEYPNALSAMAQFTSNFLDTDNSLKILLLVKALLELIDKDTSIVDTDELYINADGQAALKSVIKNISEINLPAFLLGVWHFIVLNRNDNSVGRSTYEKWHEEPSIKGAKWVYRGSIGDGITRQIAVSLDTISEAPEIEVDAEPTKENAEPFINEDSEPPKTQVLNRPVVVNQYGTNNTQIAHVETLTINNGQGG